MKDSSLKACVGAVCVTAAYGLYLGLSPEPHDGAIFAGVMTAIGSLVTASVTLAVKTLKTQ